ncbi:uncharacterized protein Z518_10618 [Rhinocladiella mackenziei CBS 650.93]|uniref:Cell wall anchored protein n=1 Tax=Rhinocladiella mackenziei CBS 650.93 TaxID=1442369 RepID=A0A0D2GQA2_9EURO|nr:uncharacterized protein Z518_10618 [Rhinocladiella mackenziei CBS 650.93]KIX00478.1 hypothetical protein Z518_10618 [Rhinocladiella mackenziei CBS 650.93]
MISHFQTALVAALLLGTANAVSVQENYTTCNWARLRAGVIRDALYLDGGQLWWQTAFADGTTPIVSSDGNVAGDMLRLNFSIPFDTTKTNVSGLFERMSKAGGAGNNIAPNYVDGTIGLPRLTDSVSAQGADAVLGYEAFQHGPDQQSWSPGFYQGSLPDGVTRYVANGAGVSAPSENLRFYFSGMRSPDWGPTYYEDSSANQTANTLIEVDMSTMRSEKWTSNTLPDHVQPRANAELVWIPVSDKGVLIAVGGVTSPEEVWASGLNDSQISESEAESPSFMTSLPVDDIASGTWYIQNTTGDGPGQLTEFCSVMATAKDSSSFHIYIYGGYDGLNSGDVPSDNVWILSVPSFTWIKAYSGNGSHGRSGHRCVTPYPDQMIVVGGIYQNQALCVEGGIIQIFNLNKLEWQNTYDPETWSEYEVPAVVSKAIGGNAQGGSTKTASWSDKALSGIFAQRYSRPITHYYPYQTNGSPTDSSGGDGSGGVTRGAIIGIGIATALIFILASTLIFLLVRRRRIIRSGSSEKSSHSSNSLISRWMNGASCGPGPKYQSTSYPEVQQVPYSSIEEEPTPPLQPQRHEMASTERPKPPYELATPYNNLDHPRHSGIVDYAYNANYGHTHSNSNWNSNSNSPGGCQPSLLTAGLGGTGRGASASPLHRVRFPPPADDISYSSHDSTSTGTTRMLAWPFPAIQNLGLNNHAQQHHHWLGHGRSSSVQPIMEKAEGKESRDQDDGGGEKYSHYHANESASGGIGTLPSPGFTSDGYGSMSRDEEQRRSPFETVSPVSPNGG